MQLRDDPASAECSLGRQYTRLRIRNGPLLRLAEHTRVVVPEIRTVALREAGIDAIAQRDFDGLKNREEGFRKRDIPQIGDNHLEIITRRSRAIAFQTHGGNRQVKFSDIPLKRARPGPD